MTRTNGGQANSAETDINTTENPFYMGRGWVWKSNPSVQEAIRVAIQRLSKDDKGATKKHILKVLFLAKESLPDDNHVKGDLAYYWYREGPYSQVVYVSLDQMVRDGLVMPHATAGSKTYHLVPGRARQPIVTDADLDVARREIGLVASENPNASDAIRSTYEKAPFKWYTTYNREFKPKFKRYCRDALAGRDGIYTDSAMLEQLDDAVLDYPTDPEFMEHRMNFMDFAKIVNAFLRRNPDHAAKDTLVWLSALCSDIWETFAYRVRMHHHDAPYDGHAKVWAEAYDKALGELDRETAKRMKQFGDVGVNEPDLAPEIKDMIRHPERHVFTPLSLEDVVENK